MPNPNDLSGTIATEATLPANSAADGQSAGARPISDVIAADQYLNNRAAATQRRRGIYFSKLITPGAFSGCGVGAGVCGFQTGCCGGYSG